MRQVFASFLLIAFAFTHTGCDDSSPVSPTPTTPTSPAPTGPSANVVMEINSPYTSETASGLNFEFTLRLRETAGVSANIDSVRAEVRRATGELEEGVEIGAGQLIQSTGSNRLAAFATRDLRLQMLFRATIKNTSSVVFKVRMTDDNRHALEVSLPYTLPSSSANMTGNWAGTAFESAGAFAVYWTASQNGKNVSGPVIISGFAEGTGRGTLSGNRLDFSFSAPSLLDACTLSWSGSLTVNGSSAEGSYSGNNCFFGSGGGRMSLRKL